MGTDIHGVWQAKKDGRWTDIESNYSQDRHYFLFAWIGNVRNGFGFAGCKTHDPLEPLTDCRGLPEDFEVVGGDTHPIDDLAIMDPRRRKWYEEGEPKEVWMGDHSHSWVTVDEVLDASDQGTAKEGWVSLKVYNEWRGGAPESWCGGVGGPDVARVDLYEETFAGLHPVVEEIVGKDVYVRVGWRVDSVKEQLSEFIDECRRLKNLHGDVRFVFGFDS